MDSHLTLTNMRRYAKVEGLMPFLSYRRIAIM
nr:MAG TPA: hypothetical protein [Caudoviricetes sp.]